MAETQQEERSEAATPRRLQKAREEGQVPVSRELTSLAGLAAVTLTVMLFVPGMLHDLARRLSIFLARAHELSAGAPVFRVAGLAWLAGAGPVVLATLLAGSAAALIQTRFLLSGRALRIDFSRISPRAGLKRLLGPESLIEAGKSLAKTAVIGFVLWRTILADLPKLLVTPYSDPNEILSRAAAPVLHVTLVVLAAQAVIAATDYFWVTLRHGRSLRMSRHDIFEEQKETEGDPRVKARLRQIRTLRARRRMLAAVPKATVVITNPTHYAVALAYDREARRAARGGQGRRYAGRPHPRSCRSEPRAGGGQSAAGAGAVPGGGGRRYPGGTLPGGGRDRRLCVAPGPQAAKSPDDARAEAWQVTGCAGDVAIVRFVFLSPPR